MPRTRSASTTESTAKRAKPEPKTIQVGDKIPSVTLKDQSGNEHAMADITGVLVLFAYPKASTPGCTKQTKGFNSHFDEFKQLGATVFGLSADSEKAQTTFKTKLELEFDLLSDPQYELLGPLGAKKQPKGVIRSHWVFKDGVCKLVEHSVKPDASPVAALEAAQEAAGGSAGGDAEDAAKDAPKEDAGQDQQEIQNESQEQDDKQESSDEGPAENAQAEETKDHVENELDKTKGAPTTTTAGTNDGGENDNENGAKQTIKAAVSSSGNQNPELVAKVATKIIAEVVTKASEEGEDIDPKNTVVSLQNSGESETLKEAKEDDNAQHAEKNGEATEGQPAKSQTPPEE